MLRVKLAIPLFVLLFAVLTAASGSAQGDIPVVEFPPLSGEYPVGLTMRVYEDETREEPLSVAVRTDNRRIPVTFYYPAAPGDDAAAAYATPEELEAFAAVMGIPPALNNFFLPNFIRDAAPLPAENGYPTLLFMPGLGSPAKFYASLLEQIASHGYVIVVIDPVYSTALSFFPDGSFTTMSPSVANVPSADLPTLGASWVEDARFILDTLETVNAEDESLAGLFDLTQVGMFGHSFGGATSFQLAHEDDRILAALDMDGTPFGSVTFEGLEKPMMFVSAEPLSLDAVTDAELEAAGLTRGELEALLASQNARIDSLFRISSDTYHVTVAGTTHSTFQTDSVLVQTLLPDFIPAEALGALEPDRAVELISDLVIAFFDTHIKGDQSPLLTGSQPHPDYPELVLEQR